MPRSTSLRAARRAATARPERAPELPRPVAVSTSAAYCALVAAATAAKRPERFASDLTQHDRCACESSADALPFVYVLGISGTYIIRPTAADAAELPAVAADAVHMSGHDSEGSALFYLWDGRALSPLRDAAHASETLRALHEARRA